MSVRTIDGHELSLTHQEKIYFPKLGITKGFLIDYYQAQAALMLPFTVNRPLTMQRFVEGIRGKNFYQKNISDYFPVWIKRQLIAHTKDIAESTEYIVCNNAATLVYIANQGCITPHAWLSTIDSLDKPDTLIIDLDPYQKKISDFKPLVDAARFLKSAIEEHHLTAFVMTTGSRGLHIRSPLKTHHSFDTVRSYVKTIAERLIREYPSLYTLESHKDKRGARILIDTMRNSFGATAVVPYAVRAGENAPVATPLYWHELDDASLRSTTYTITHIPQRLSSYGDPWHDFKKHARSLQI